MEVITRTTMSSSSSLNPNAPLFIPRAYQAVEDFSDEWWELVGSSPWFSDYWLQECFQDPQNTPPLTHDDDDDLEYDVHDHDVYDDVYVVDDDVYVDDDDDLLPNIDSIFDGYTMTKQEEEEEKEYGKDLVSLRGLKWNRSAKSTPKLLFEKVPKYVNVKVNPRPIQQPR